MKLITECLDNYTEWVNNSRQIYIYIYMIYLLASIAFYG